MFATLLARETGGRPVKVTWTREEDTRHDVYRPAAARPFPRPARRRRHAGRVDMQIASPSIIASMLRRVFPSLSPLGPDKLIVEGSYDQPYTIADYRVVAHQAEIGIPVGSWRSVGNSFNGFFHESFLDEVAAAGKVDPVAMRRKLMADFPAALAVVDKVADDGEMGRGAAGRQGQGLCLHAVVRQLGRRDREVADTPSGIRIEKVWIAADVGIALDPGIIEAQLVSGAIYGMSSAMGQEITFADGMVEQSNFHDFDAMRMNQCPAFEVAMLENYHKMGGVGEVGTPPAVAALANAVSALTGKRVRSLPISKQAAFA